MSRFLEFRTENATEVPEGEAVALLQGRWEVVRQIGDVKARTGTDVIDPARKEAVHSRWTKELGELGGEMYPIVHDAAAAMQKGERAPVIPTSETETLESLRLMIDRIDEQLREIVREYAAGLASSSRDKKALTWFRDLVGRSGVMETVA